MNSRTTGVMRSVATGENRLMACGDARTAVMLVQQGFLRRISDRREFTGSYELTDKGVIWVKTHLQDVELEK